MFFFPTIHFDSACQKSEMRDQNAKTDNALTAAMKKNMAAFLKKCTQKHYEVECQSEGGTASAANVPEEMIKETEDQYDSEGDLDLDSTL